MKALTRKERWDPFQDLFGLRTRPFEDLFNLRQLDRMLPRLMEENEMIDYDWMPVTDLVENKDKFTVRTELPGMTEKDVHVEMDGRLLKITGEKKFEKKTEDENYHRIESSYGRFYRSFTLPEAVKEDKIEATFENGILTVEIPKKEGSKPKQIPVGNKKKIKAA